MVEEVISPAGSSLEADDDCRGVSAKLVEGREQ